MYSLMDPIRSIVPLIRHKPDPAHGFPTRREALSAELNPRQLYLDGLTKWPAKGKAVEHAQQNVKAAVAPAVSGRARAGIYKGIFIPSFG
jgi:hypothetical protein